MRLPHKHVQSIFHISDKKERESIMEKLNYDVIKKVGYGGYLLKEAPEKVMQFGEGNFCLVQPIAQGLSDMINEQEGLYTLYLRGSENGQKVDDKRVISSAALASAKYLPQSLHCQYSVLPRT